MKLPYLLNQSVNDIITDDSISSFTKQRHEQVCKSMMTGRRESYGLPLVKYNISAKNKNEKIIK